MLLAAPSEKGCLVQPLNIGCLAQRFGVSGLARSTDNDGCTSLSKNQNMTFIEALSILYAHRPELEAAIIEAQNLKSHAGDAPGQGIDNDDAQKAVLRADFTVSKSTTTNIHS